MLATLSANTIRTLSRSQIGTQSLNQRRSLRQIPDGLLQRLVLWPEPLWQPELVHALAKRRPKQTAMRRLRLQQELTLRQEEAEARCEAERQGAQLEAHLQPTPRRTPTLTHRLHSQEQPHLQQQQLPPREPEQQQPLPLLWLQLLQPFLWPAAGFSLRADVPQRHELEDLPQSLHSRHCRRSRPLRPHPRMLAQHCPLASRHR